MANNENQINYVDERKVVAHVNSKFPDITSFEKHALVKEITTFLNVDYVGYWQKTADIKNAYFDKQSPASDIVAKLQSYSQLNDLLVPLYEAVRPQEMIATFNQHKAILKDKFKAEYSGITDFIFITPAWENSKLANIREEAFERGLKSAYYNKLVSDGKAFLKINTLASVGAEAMSAAIFRSHRIEPSDFYIKKILTAIDNKDVGKLRDIVGYNHNVASRDVFSMVTGVKILASSTEKNARLTVDNYCEVSPERRLELNANKEAAREVKSTIRDADYAWRALTNKRIIVDSADPSKTVAISEYIKSAVEGGWNVIHTFKKGAALVYSLSNGMTNRSVKDSDWSAFLKCAIKLGGIEMAIEAVEVKTPVIEPDEPQSAPDFSM